MLLRISLHTLILKKMIGEAVLLVEDKGEVAGNLVAAILSGAGVSFFSFGEYFEAKPLIKLVKPAAKVEELLWADGVAYSVLDIKGKKVKETLVVYGDTLVYSIVNLSNEQISFEFKGELYVFSWFNPSFRRRITELAKATFKALEGLGVEASYGNVYWLYIASNGVVKTKMKRGGVSYHVEARLNEGAAFTFVIACSASKEEALRNVKNALKDPISIERDKRKQVGDMLKTIRGLDDVKPDYRRLWKYMWYVILSNRVRLKAHPVLKNPFNMPSKYVFRHQWLWDSAFHAIVLSMYSVEMAEEELLNLFEAQKPDGRIPHEIFLSKEFCRLFWNVDDYSPWTTQPPVIAIAVDLIMRRNGSAEFLRRAFEALDRYDRWFRAHRDADQDELMAYVDYLESGWDDSVRWDEAKAAFNRNPERYRSIYREIRMAPIEAVDLNCFIYVQRRVLARLADKLGLKDKAQEYLRLAEKTAEGVKRLMWDDETGFFYDITEDDHKPIRVKTPAAFTTLYVGLASKSQAERLVEHLLNPGEFWTTFPLPSVSADNPKYDPRGYWRGRSWLNMVWFTYHGLRRYGFDNEAEALARKVLDTIAKTLTCSENYDSSTGDPLGAPDFGWTSLALDMIRDLSSSGG